MTSESSGATATIPRAPASPTPSPAPAAPAPNAQIEEEGELSLAHRIANLTIVVTPFLGLIAALVLLWNRLVGWHDVGIMFAMYVVTGLGVTVGFHRLFTHRAFETYRSVRATFAILGSMAVEGPVITWVADHRKHHTFADEEGDPHSPHVDHTGGRLAMLRGLWHAHMGWLFEGAGRANLRRFAPDLLGDKLMRRINSAFLPLVLASFAIPGLIGYILTGRLTGALTAIVWGGLVRIFFLHHMTWSINSVCHFFGRRRFRTNDQSTNVFWLALPSFGESWHHNHHAFPRAATHGLRRWELDISALVIKTLEKVGLAWNVVRVSAERQAAKIAPLAG